MNYGVGDEVVCIDAQGYPGNLSLHGTQLVAGDRYTVRDIVRQPCCGVSSIDVGIVPLGSYTQCVCGYVSRPSHGLKGAWRFIKLDGLAEQQTEKDEVAA